MARSPSPGSGSSPPQRRGRRSRSETPRSHTRSRSRSRSPRSRTPSGTPSRSPTRSRSRSRSRAPSDTGNDGDGKLEEGVIEYDDFVAADEEKPTFSLGDTTLDLIRSKVYQAAPLGKKHYNDLKLSSYLMARSVHETLEPKPIPPQVVSAVNGMDMHKVHSNLLTIHNVSRVAQRPIWASMELLQKTRGSIKKQGMVNFVSPPHLPAPNSSLPDGHVEMPYSEEDELRYMASCPQNPTQAQVNDMYKTLGVYKKFHEYASKSMVSMVSTIKGQQACSTMVKSNLDEMWSRTQDYINMARYLETQLKETRRSQLVKAHSKDFVDWLENVHHKDRARLGARDSSDEILAADYDGVVKQYQEYKKFKNTALKSSHNPRRSGASSSNRENNVGGGSGVRRDNRRDDPPPRRDDSGGKQQHQRQYKAPRQPRKNDSKGSRHQKKSDPKKDKTA